MNIVVLTGRLSKDPEVRYSQGETPTCIANFTLAVDRRFKKEGQPTADFVNCTAFGKTGEFIGKYTKKGMALNVKGNINVSSYDKDGEKRWSTRVNVDEAEFGESKAAYEARMAAKGGNTEPIAELPEDFEPAGDIEDEDLPF